MFYQAVFVASTFTQDANIMQQKGRRDSFMEQGLFSELMIKDINGLSCAYIYINISTYKAAQARSTPSFIFYNKSLWQMFLLQVGILHFCVDYWPLLRFG